MVLSFLVYCRNGRRDAGICALRGKHRVSPGAVFHTAPRERPYACSSVTPEPTQNMVNSATASRRWLSPVISTETRAVDRPR